MRCKLLNFCKTATTCILSSKESSSLSEKEFLDADYADLRRFFDVLGPESAFSAFIYVLVIIDNHRQSGRCA